MLLQRCFKLVFIFALTCQFASFQAEGKAKPQVIFVSDELASGDNLIGASLVIEKLRQVLTNQLQFSYIKASRKREWRELTQNNNVCLFNKIKTPVREQDAHFSSLPIQIFPPNQLIVLDNDALPPAMTIQQAIEVYNLNIAIQAGRSYGEDTDIQLKAFTNKLTVIEGVNSTDRIMRMMINRRVDAIVEYPTVIATNLEEQGKNNILERTRAYQIQNGSGFAHGFIACSKTAEGNSIIEIINDALMTKDMQDMMINLNISYFPKISHPSILNEWLSLTGK